MSTSVYTVNKGINKSIEFKGLKAQYIWYLGGGLLALLDLFAILYIAGLNTYVLLAVTILLATLLCFRVYRLSNTYGEHGMMKKLARRSIPRTVRITSRHLFTQSSK